MPEPELRQGDKALDEDDHGGSFGALAWLMVLSERLPREQALTAVDGWGGDSYVAYERDGRQLHEGQLPRRHPGGPRADADRPAGLGGQGPKGSASVTRQDLTLVFESCDPGKNAAKVASGKSMDALALALSRTYLSLQLVKVGLDVPLARCGADRLVRVFTLAQLNSPHLDRPRASRPRSLPCRHQV